MKIKLAWLLLACVLGACQADQGDPPRVAAAAAIAPLAAPVGDAAEGLRVATRVGCNGCHEKDGRGGVFMDIPNVGRFVAANLTQRRALYDDAGLRALLHQGKTHDGHRPLGMPIVMFQHLSDRDIDNLIAWIRALPAVENPGLPAGTLSDATKKQLADGTFPFDDDVPAPGVVAPAVRPIEQRALGEYLAMTTCVECHGRTLDGFGPDDKAPSLVLVAKAYSNENFARLMKTGITAAGKESTSGLMTEISRGRLSSMTDEEITALKAYLDAR